MFCMRYKHVLIHHLEGDSPHKKFMIVCECTWSSYVNTFHILMLLLSCKSFMKNATEAQKF